MKNKIITFTCLTFLLFFTHTTFADTGINLQVKNNTSTIYNSDISVAPCDSEGDGVLKATPYCALVQAGVSSDWTGLWVNSINGVVNNDGGNGVYWMWLANLNIDTSPTSSYSLSSKQYILQDSDKILFYYNTNPLDIIVDKENPKVGETIKITGKELGLDSSWNPVWNSASLGKVLINGNSYDLDANGEFVFEINNSDSLNIKIQKDNFIDSKELTIQPEEIKRSSGSYIRTNIIAPNIIEKVFSVSKALEFLSINQKNDGSYGEQLYTDWVAIGVGAGDDKTIKDKLIKYYKENNLEISSVTDYERHAMAFMALGINPYNETKINYIKKIIDSFDGEQFGDKTLINDDIFALIVLKNVGYNSNDEIIIKDIKYIISKQEVNGSLGSVDMTSAFIQALRGFESILGVVDAISKSENYIISNQKNDGGFENSFSTAWVLQSMYKNENILKSEKYLSNKQMTDGGIDDIALDINTRIWTTSYTIPAMLHKSWDDILNDFPKQEISARQDLAEVVGEKVNKEIKINNKIILSSKNKQITKPEEKITENLTQTIEIPRKDEILPKSTNVWGTLKRPFSWLLVKLGF